MTTLVLASNNKKKRDELFAALAPHLPDVTILTLRDVGLTAPIEDADSFVGNALIKARHCVNETGLAAIADDSGLCVDVLDGQPGIFSARYAGETATDADNNEKLLTALADRDCDRPHRAAFHAAIVFATPDGQEHVAEATMPGIITTESRGTNGFGYDPLFFSDAHNHMRTNAELSRAEKQAISHRGQALQELLPAIIRFVTQTD